MWRKMFGEIKKQLLIPFKSLSLERGVSPIAVSLAISAVGYVGVKTTKEIMSRVDSEEKSSVSNLYLNLANETGLEQAAQLIGNFVISVDKQRNIFIPGYQIAGIEAGSGYKPISKPNPTWQLENGKLYINSCLMPRLSASKAGYVFNNNDDVQWISDSDLCANEFSVTTEISVERYFREAAQVSEFDQEYLIVNATTRVDDLSLSRRARVKYGDTTKVCLVGNDSEVCNVDHCKFMMPLKDQYGNVVYNQDGTFGLMPNPYYYEPLVLSVDTAAHTIQKLTADDPEPTALKDWLNGAYSMGRRDPFNSWQGIRGKIEKISLVNRDSAGNVTLNIPPDQPSGTKALELIEFDGYMWKLYGLEPDSVGSAAIQWPAGQSYESLEQGLKGGCQRTIGASEPDFCTRIHLTYETQKYSYPEVLSCDFVGPARSPNDLSGNVRSWEQRRSLIDYGPWERTQSDNVGRRIIADNRTRYRDPYPHHDFGPSGEIHQSYAHDFSDVLIGTVEEEEIRSESDIFDSSNDESESSEDEDSGDNEEYYKRKITYKWDVDCDKRQTSDLVYNHNMSVCYYLAYSNLKERFSCRREVSAYICRNGNGCFARGTEIRMANGNHKAIENIKQGDLVYNPLTGEAVKVAQVIVGDKKKAFYRIKAGENELIVTYNHPFLTGDGLKKAEDLKTSDILYIDSLKSVAISKIERLPEDSHGTHVWNILLQKHGSIQPSSYQDHFLMANGVVTGDYHIQNMQMNEMAMEFQDFDSFLISKGIP